MWRSVFAGASLLLSAAVIAQTELHSWSDWKLTRTIEIEASIFHVQGIDFDADHFWITSVDSAHRKGYLQEFGWDSGARVRGVELQDGERFHPGGFASDATSLWIPVAEYRRESSAVIQRRNKRSLKIEESFQVADHIGCIAVNSEYVVGGNWDSRDFYLWDRHGNLIRKIASETGNAYQDMKFDEGMLVGSGLLADRSGAIDWLEFPSMRLVRRVATPRTGRQVSFSQEGMSIRGRQLVLLPEDEPSRVFVFMSAP